MLTMFSYPRAQISESPWNIFSSFSSHIWILIAFFFVVYGILNWVNDKHSLNSRLLALSSSYSDMFALMLGQGTVPMSGDARSVHRNPLIVWILGAFVLRQLWSSEIMALLVSRGQMKFDSFSQIAKAGKSLKILIEYQSSSYYIFKEKFPALVPQLELISYDEVSSIATLQKVIHSNSILVCSREYAELVRDHYLTIGFHISREGYISSIGNYAIRRNLDTIKKNKLKKLFRNIYYFGLTKKVDRTIAINNFRNALRAKTPLHQIESIISPANLRGLKSSEKDISKSTVIAYVYIYSIGIVVAISIFTVEFVLYFCCEMPKKL